MVGNHPESRSTTVDEDLATVFYVLALLVVLRMDWTSCSSKTEKAKCFAPALVPDRPSLASVRERVRGERSAFGLVDALSVELDVEKAQLVAGDMEMGQVSVV